MPGVSRKEDGTIQTAKQPMFFGRIPYLLRFWLVVLFGRALSTRMQFRATPFKYFLVLVCGVAVSGCCHIPRPSQNTGIAIPYKDFPYSFNKAPCISPKIIQDLSAWISDSGDQVVSINLLKSQHSNRYFGEVQIRTNETANPYVYIESSVVEGGETNHTEFGYQYVGETKSGIYVLETSDWGGGSGVFKSLLLVKIGRDSGMVCDWNKSAIESEEPRLIIKKLGEIALDDRWDGDLKVEGNSVYVGKDHGWFTLSGGTGGGDLSHDRKGRVLKVEPDR